MFGHWGDHVYKSRCRLSVLQVLLLLSLHPLCGGGDLLFLLSPPAAAATTCFCSHSKTPTGQFHNFGRKLRTLYPIAKLKIK